MLYKLKNFNWVVTGFPGYSYFPNPTTPTPVPTCPPGQPPSTEPRPPPTGNSYFEYHQQGPPPPPTHTDFQQNNVHRKTNHANSQPTMMMRSEIYSGEDRLKAYVTGRSQFVIMCVITCPVW